MQCDKPVRYGFYCDKNITAQVLRTCNATHIMAFCDPTDKKSFNFGIYVYALQSNFTRSTYFPRKFLQSFWWGLRNLRFALCTSEIAWYVSFSTLYTNADPNSVITCIVSISSYIYAPIYACSSFGSNLETSSDMLEISFSILTSISGLVLFLIYLNARVEVRWCW